MKPLYFTIACACISLPAWAIPVSVSVVGPDGKPLPMARVSVLRGVAPEKDALATNKPVGPMGQFNFEWDGEFAAGKVLPTDYVAPPNLLWVRITAPGMATQATALTAGQTTIELSASHSWGGIILDQNEKPIVGARVQLKSWLAPEAGNRNIADARQPQFAFGFDADTIDKSWKVEAITDANGRWQLDDVPAQGRATISLHDPRYVVSNYDLDLAKAAPLLFMTPGATITGQIVKPNGEPLANSPIYLSRNNDVTTRTNDAGRFVLSGVEAGKVTLTPDRFGFGRSTVTTPPDFLVQRLPYVQAIAGQTTDIGQWKAQTGTLISMRVVDDGTGAPIEGAQFWVSNVGYRAVSDASGQLRVRVLPSANLTFSRFFNSAGRLSADGYLDSSLQNLPELNTPSTLDAGVIRLRRGTILRGQARIEGEGAGVAPASTLRLPTLRLTAGKQSASLSFRQGTGEVVTTALEAGDYKVSTDDSSTMDGNWQIISPFVIGISAPGAPVEPLEIVLKRLPLPDNLMRQARGRIVDENGRGVEGAVIRATWTRGGFTDVVAVTDANGDWSVGENRLARSIDIKSVERPGYITVGTARTTIANNIGTVSGITLKKRGASFVGRVVDEAGQPVAGAWVTALEARDVASVQTDANGRFELADLPLDKFTLVAAKDTLFARSPSASTATNVALTLQPLAPAIREALAERALAGKMPQYDLFNFWDILGAQRMEDVAGASGSGRTAFVMELSQRDPAEFLKRAPALIETLDENDRNEVEAQLFWVSAAADDAAKAAAQRWVDQQKTVKRGINTTSVMQILRMAAVAHRLGRADADDLSDYAAAIATQTSYGSSLARRAWGEMLSKSGAWAVESFVEGAKPLIEFELLNTASVALARQGDARGAAHVLARLETLASAPELASMSNGGKQEGAASKAKRARFAIAHELADSDVAAAWQTIEAHGDALGNSNTYLVIADRAIAAGQTEIATQALRIAVKRLSNIEKNSALAASLGQQISPQLGAELWAQALLNTAQPKDSDYRPSIAMWAFYHARLDAGLSRLMLEREWSWRTSLESDRLSQSLVSNDTVLDQLTLAMTAVDPTRALEMRAQLVADKGATATPMDLRFAAALLASDAQRIRFDVNARF